MMIVYLLKTLLQKGLKAMLDLVTLLNNLKTSIDALQAQLVDAEAAAKSAYDKGFADGVASVVPSVGPTQAELDAALAKISELQAKVSELETAQVAAVAAAVLKVKESAKVILDKFAADEAAEVEAAKSEVDAL